MPSHKVSVKEYLYSYLWIYLNTRSVLWLLNINQTTIKEPQQKFGGHNAESTTRRKKTSYVKVYDFKLPQPNTTHLISFHSLAEATSATAREKKQSQSIRFVDLPKTVDYPHMIEQTHTRSDGTHATRRKIRQRISATYSTYAGNDMCVYVWFGIPFGHRKAGNRLCVLYYRKYGGWGHFDDIALQHPVQT